MKRNHVCSLASLVIHVVEQKAASLGDILMNVIINGTVATAQQFGIWHESLMCRMSKELNVHILSAI